MAISSILYCLIAQDNSSSNNNNNSNKSKLQIVNLTLGNYFISGYNLEEIDLYTTQFSCEEELLEALYCNKLISHLDVNLFIAFRSPITGKVEKYNVLYNHSQKSLVQNIRQVAWQSLSGFLADNSDLNNIITAFSMRVVADGNYYKIIDCGLSRVDSALLQLVASQAYFVSFSDIENFASERLQTSYEVFRNIVESFVNYKHYLFEIIGNGLINPELLGYDQFRWLSRFENIDVAVLSDLLELVDDGPQLGGQQIINGWCLPVNADAFELPHFEESAVSINTSGRFLVAEIPNYSKYLQPNDMIEYVLSILTTLPPNCFVKRGNQQRAATFNTAIFTLSEDDERSLVHYLDSRCRFLFFQYIFRRDERTATLQGPWVRSERKETKHGLNQIKRNIKKYLGEHQEALNRAYAWSQAFETAVLGGSQVGEKSERGAYVKRYSNKNGS